jgi:hypothetical protein
MKFTANTEINPKWQCRWATRSDQNALLDLFESSFGQTMPKDLWQWKYARLEKSGMLAHVDDSIIAYYGGIPRIFSLNGTTVNAVQSCDVMVAPRMRGILTRRGPFMRTADTFLREQTGLDKPYRFAFGFPSDRHARLGEKTGWYTRTDTFLEVSWAPHCHRQRSLPLQFRITPLSPQDEAVIDRLWQGMRSVLPDCLIPVKDASFFKWRYLNHPSHAYATYIVAQRWSGRIIGIIALRDHADSNDLELLDLLGPPESMTTLLKTACHIAHRTDRKRLFSWMTPAILRHLPEPFTAQEISGVYVTPDYKQMADERQLSWWLMCGDTDFR